MTGGYIVWASIYLKYRLTHVRALYGVVQIDSMKFEPLVDANIILILLFVAVRVRRYSIMCILCLHIEAVTGGYFRYIKLTTCSAAKTSDYIRR